MRKDGTTDALRQRIMQWERGRIIFIDDFADVESQWGVRFGLSQLAEEGFIYRLARGVYLYPRIEGEYSMKSVAPDPETIAYAIAAKDRIRIIPFGDQAAYKLGLTSIRISDLKYLSDGAPRKIHLSNEKKIMFFHTSEVRMFDFCNETMQLVASAIRALGEEMIDDEKKRIIHAHLRNVPEKEFKKDITLPPAWVSKIILNIWNN